MLENITDLPQTPCAPIKTERRPSDNINLYDSFQFDICDVVMFFHSPNFDIDRVMAFFRAYHGTTGNLALHCLASPVIPWTIFVWTTLLGGIRATYLTAGLFQAYYFCLHWVYSLAFAPVFIMLVTHAISYAQQTPGAGMTALGLHVASWLVQIVGHGAVEGRKSAIKDTLLQAIVQAPFLLYIQPFLLVDKDLASRSQFLAEKLYPK